MTSSDVLDLLGIEISPARMKCALLSLETLQGALGPSRADAGADRRRPRRGPHDARRRSAGPLQVSVAGLSAGAHRPSPAAAATASLLDVPPASTRWSHWSSDADRHP